MIETTVEVVLPAVYDNLPEICNRLERLEQKAPQIIDWNTDSNLNDYVLPGTYICNNGLRTNQGDNLPITNLGENARFGFTLVVTQATSNENGNHHQVIGQSLILTNRLGNETKHYSRSKKYVINNAATPPEVTEDLWSPWQELQGTTFLGQVTKSQLDKVIDNGIYTGVVMDNELLPQGSTFTMLVMNNYAVNSAVGMPAQARQVSQTFIYLPLADVSSGAIKNQNGQMLQRTGIGGEVVNWSSLGNPNDKVYVTSGDGHFNIDTDIYNKVIVAFGGPDVVYLDFIATKDRIIEIVIERFTAYNPIISVNGVSIRADIPREIGVCTLGISLLTSSVIISYRNGTKYNI